MKIGPALLGVIAGSSGAAAGTPTFIGAASAGGGGTITVPAHAAGDILIVFGKRTGSAPGATAGYVTPTNGTWSAPAPSTQAYRLEWNIDETNTIATHAVDTGDVKVCLVYRGCTVGNVAVALTAVAAVVTAPALSSSGPYGSLMLQIFTDSLNEWSSVTGSDTLRYNQDIGLGGGDVAIVDSAVLVASATPAQATFAASGYLTANTFELLP